MKNHWIVTTVGKDRPGIVAGVTKILYRLGCNLEDSAMTRLGGEFAIMLIFSGPDRLTEAALQTAFGPLARRLALAVHLKRLSAREASRPSGAVTPYLLSVYGADRAGIVFRVSEALAAAGVNITDVQTHRSAPPGQRGGRTLYIMLLQVELSTRLAASSLERTLRRIGKQLGVEVSLRSAEADVL